MPFVIYVFTISAFALGLAEFVPIGLTDVMAQGLCVGVEQTGAAVTTYALGATFAAPVLSALTASWSRKNVMLTTAVVFTAGSLAAAFAATLPQLLLARFIAGLGHGLSLPALPGPARRAAVLDAAARNRP
ncbi:MFS transporter, partial [Escherichia sp. TWPC-MK]